MNAILCPVKSQVPDNESLEGRAGVRPAAFPAALGDDHPQEALHPQQSDRRISTASNVESPFALRVCWSDIGSTKLIRGNRMPNKPRGRIEAEGVGIGAVSDKLLQRRAQDLAEEDGRTEARDADRAEALKELSGLTEDPPPEVPPGDENLTTWNESPDLTGHAAPTFPPDDETDIAEELTEEGVEEADVDRRRAAKDEYRSDAS